MLFQNIISFEVLKLTLILLETVQPIRFYSIFYNWLNDFKIIYLKVLLEKSKFLNLYVLIQNIIYYETETI